MALIPVFLQNSERGQLARVRCALLLDAAEQINKQHCLLGMSVALGDRLDETDGCGIKRQGSFIIQRSDHVA